MSNTSAKPLLKKGNTSWKPASVTDVVDKDPNFRYRWSGKNPDNLAKKKAEGWETVSGLSSDQTNSPESNRVNDGRQLTSTLEKTDVILQRLPEELGRERDEYFNNETQRRESGLTAHIKKDLAKEGAGMHGKITISSRKGEQTIE